MTTTSSLSTKLASFLRSRNKDKPSPSNVESTPTPSQNQLDRLPPELLSVVFAHSRDSERIHGLPTRETFPLNLAAVCRAWRSIVNTTPELWTRIPRCHLHSAGRRYLDLITLFVARSGVLPLDIHVESPFKDFSTHPIVPVLLSCAERWEVVHLSTSIATLKVFASAIGALPELRSIKLELWDYGRSNTLWRISSLAMSPKLREVSISGWPGIEVEFKGLDWTQILYYSVNGGSNDHVGSSLDHLGSMQKLRSLSIMGWSPSPAANGTPPSFHILPCLSNLTVDDPIYLDSLSTPSIQHLFVLLKSEDTGLYRDPFTRIVELIRRSNAETKLETLDINTRYDTPGDAKVLLKLLHNLRVLRIPLFHGFRPIEDAILQGYTSNRQNGLPLLEELVLRDALPIVTIDGAAKRLNAIGARVDIPSASDQTDAASPPSRVRLRKFELEFGNVMEGKKALGILGGFWEDEGSNEVDEKDFCLETIQDWRTRLIELFPELLDQSAPTMRRFNPFFPAHFDKLFEEMSRAKLRNMAFFLLVCLPVVWCMIVISDAIGFIVTNGTSFGPSKDQPHARWTPPARRKIPLSCSSRGTFEPVGN